MKNTHTILLSAVVLFLTIGMNSGPPSLAEDSPLPALDDPSVADSRAVVTFAVSDFQPAINRTGPINWIARNPRAIDEVFVSSVTSGLWKSTDGGRNWIPIRSLPPWSVSAVAYVFDGTLGGAILVTTQEDFRVRSGAGVWRSEDHGNSWTQVAEVPGECSEIPRAHGIAVRGTSVAVATSCGVLLSATGGRSFGKFPATAFFPRGVLTGLSERFFSVEYTPSGALLVGGDAGLFYRMRAASHARYAMRGTGEMRRAFAVSPSIRHSNFVLALSGTRETHRMLISHDEGQTWRPVASGSSAAGGGSGGSPFVRIIPVSGRSADVYVYYGDSLAWYRAGPFPNGDLSPLETDPSIRWQQQLIGHPDPHDLDFQSRPGERLDSRSLILATDGGLETCSFGLDPNDEPACHERNVLGTSRGLSGIQIMDIEGQIVGTSESAERRIYFVSWHTDKWASPDNGGTWILRGGEAAWLDMERLVKRRSDAQIIYNNNALPNMLADDLMADGLTLRNAGGDASPPLLLRKGVLVQSVTTVAGTALYGVTNVTRETAPLIRTWIPVANYETCPIFGPCTPLSTHQSPLFAGSWEGDAFVYQPYSNRLALVRGILSMSRGEPRLTSGTVTYPDMTWTDEMRRRHEVRLGVTWSPLAGFGSVPVVGADPLNPSHLVIPDINNGKVMRSLDAGQTWTPIEELSEAVTTEATGRPLPGFFQFKINRGGLRVQSMVSSISFFPDDPNLVILGTVENGLFFSKDRAATWEHIPDTEHITNAVAFHWRSANSVIVGSWGRGLFEIRMRYILPEGFLTSICRDCKFASAESEFASLSTAKFTPSSAILKAAQQQFDEAVLVLGGSINGVESSEGHVKSVSVTIGGSVYRFGDRNPRSEFVTEEHTGFLGYRGLTMANQLRNRGMVLKGLTFINGRISHVIYGSQQTPIPAPVDLGPVRLPKATDPHLKDPYLRVFGPGMTMGLIASGGVFELQGFLFEPNSAVELRVDGEARRQARTDATGRFSVLIAAPTYLGPHEILARQSIGKRTLRAEIGFSVKNSAEKRN